MSTKGMYSNCHFKFTIPIEASIEKVWDQLINVSTWNEWDTELKDAYIFGQFKMGTKGQLTPKVGPKLKFEITGVEKNKSYTFKTKMPAGYLVIRRKLLLKDGVTHFTDDIQFTGFLKHVFGFFLGRSFKSVLPEVMRNFKSLVENK